MCHMRCLCDDLGDLQFSVMLPVPDRAPVLLFALELEYSDLLGAVVVGNSGDHFGGAQLRLGKHFAVFKYSEYVRYLERRADIEGQLLDPDHVAGRHTVLLSTSLNDCVHETFFCGRAHLRRSSQWFDFPWYTNRAPNANFTGSSGSSQPSVT